MPFIWLLTIFVGVVLYTLKSSLNFNKISDHFKSLLTWKMDESIFENTIICTKNKVEVEQFESFTKCERWNKNVIEQEKRKKIWMLWTKKG